MTAGRRGWGRQDNKDMMTSTNNTVSQHDKKRRGKNLFILRRRADDGHSFSKITVCESSMHWISVCPIRKHPYRTSRVREQIIKSRDGRLLRSTLYVSSDVTAVMTLARLFKAGISKDERFFTVIISTT
jgi:hypothetical protein